MNIDSCGKDVPRVSINYSNIVFPFFRACHKHQLAVSVEKEAEVLAPVLVWSMVPVPIIKIFVTVLLLTLNT